MVNNYTSKDVSKLIDEAFMMFKEIEKEKNDEIKRLINENKKLKNILDKNKITY